MTPEQTKRLALAQKDIRFHTTTMVGVALMLAATFIEAHAMEAGAHPTLCNDCEGSASYAEHMAEWLTKKAEELIK